MSKTSSMTICFLFLFALFFHDHAFAETKSGEIDLLKAQSKTAAITFTMGTKVTVKCGFYIYGPGTALGTIPLRLFSNFS